MTDWIFRDIDQRSISGWLAENIPEAEPPFGFDLIAGGHSNLTYLVTSASGARFVLRRPPFGTALETAHDMVREYRIITAIGRSKVPVPSALGLCEDPAIAGASFYVMEYVPGNVLNTGETVDGLSNQDKQQLTDHLIDVLADLHSADIDAIGLGTLSKREGYIERQVKRWLTQWSYRKTRELAEIDEVGSRLLKNLPAQEGTSIVHGDYRFGNCLADLSSKRIAAVLDWELCTLGDPLADVGYLGVYWYGGDDSPAKRKDPTVAGDFPPYTYLLARYAERTGRDLSQVDYYIAFSYWRLAVITEGVYRRFLERNMGPQQDVDLNAIKTGTEALALRALMTLERL